LYYIPSTGLGAMLKAVKHAWTVDKLTSGAFVGTWRERVADLYSKYMATAVVTVGSTVSNFSITAVTQPASPVLSAISNLWRCFESSGMVGR
jgi:hypothetical protein